MPSSHDHSVPPSRHHPITPSPHCCITSPHFPITPSPHHAITTFRILPRLLLAVPLLASLGCEAAVGGLVARASDQWTHTYPLADKGQVQISSGNGDIEIEGVDGSTVEVHAERVARAATDAAAHDLLPRISIKEDVTPILPGRFARRGANDANRAKRSINPKT